MSHTDDDLTFDCDTCAGKHDVAIHAATISIHRWLRSEIARKLAEVTPGATSSKEWPGKGPGKK